MNVSLTPELEQMVAAKVQSGMYHSASEVIREGLRLLAEQDELKKQRIAQLNAEIDKGLASVKAGRVVSGEELKAHIKTRRTTFRADHA